MASFCCIFLCVLFILSLSFTLFPGSLSCHSSLLSLCLLLIRLTSLWNLSLSNCYGKWIFTHVPILWSILGKMEWNRFAFGFRSSGDQMFDPWAVRLNHLSYETRLVIPIVHVWRRIKWNHLVDYAGHIASSRSVCHLFLSLPSWPESAYRDVRKLWSFSHEEVIQDCTSLDVEGIFCSFNDTLLKSQGYHIGEQILTHMLLYL